MVQVDLLVHQVLQVLLVHQVHLVQAVLQVQVVYLIDMQQHQPQPLH
jgi:hypothetical protein